MENEDLTEYEKMDLLGHVDARLHQDYDETFYDALCATEMLLPDDIAPRIRRAILAFTNALWDEFKVVSPYDKDDTTVLAAIYSAFIKGYEFGRKRNCPITTES